MEFRSKDDSLILQNVQSEYLTYNYKPGSEQLVYVRLSDVSNGDTKGCDGVIHHLL